MKNSRLFIFTSVSLLLFTGQVLAPTNASAYDTVCEKFRRNFEKLTKKYPYAALAEGRGDTLSGISGCGWAGHKRSLASAKRRALHLCKRGASTKDKGCKIQRTKP